MESKKFLAAIVATFAVFGVTLQASAATYNYNFSNEFSGGTAPAGSAPWASLSFTDVAGGVEMELRLNAWTGFVSEFDINYGGNPGTNSALTPLGFIFQSGQVAGSIAKSADSYQADGDGKFDIRFSFPSANNPARLAGGESVKYLITGSSGANLFNNTSLTGGGNGTWYAALHVQGLPTGSGSGWLGATAPVPEPETYGMILAGFGLLGLMSRRKSQRVAKVRNY